MTEKKDHIRIALDTCRQAWQNDGCVQFGAWRSLVARLPWAHVLLTDGLKEEGPGDGHWFPVIPWVRDDGFYAVCLREPMMYQDACRLFGFDIPAGKPSVPKRIKRDVARGKTSLFGELLETRELNEWDLLHTVMLADGKTTFQVATYSPSNRWPEAWTSGASSFLL